MGSSVISLIGTTNDVDYDDNFPSTLSYEDFVRGELPSVVRRELENRVDALLVNAEENLRTQIPEIFREVSISLYHTYRQFRTTQSLSNTSLDLQHDPAYNPADNGFTFASGTDFFPDTYGLESNTSFEPFTFSSSEFNNTILFPAENMLPATGAGVDALMATEDWNFLGLTGDASEEYADQIPRSQG